MTSQWQPYREPLQTTLLRNFFIATGVGFILAMSWGGLARWPAAALLVLWPALGGHLVEIGFLNHLRSRLPAKRPVQVAVRLAVWFIAGVILFGLMAMTASAFAGFRRMPWQTLWLGGPAFIGVELLAHLALQWRGRPSFYNGRG